MLSSVILNISRAIYKVAPAPIWRSMRTIYYATLRITGRAKSQAEATKARARRTREGFFDSYCTGRGLDIGYGGDLVVPTAEGWDIEHGDAQYLQTLGNAQFDFVHASHTLEHMIDPAVALTNWWRVLKPGGHLLIYLPHRDLYEKKTELPSNWNPDHKYFYLLDRDEAPVTLGLVPLLERTLTDGDIVYAKVCSEGHTIDDPAVHSDGEYSIEAVIRKR